MTSFAISLVAVLAFENSGDGDRPTFSAGRVGADGVVVHEVTSPFQKGTTEIRVLLPDHMEKGKTYPVIYLLPVEAGRESRFGDGIAEVKKLDLHNRWQVIFVAPTFSHLPWYADHPTNSHVRQESYFLQIVLPFIERTYPVIRQAEGRLLLGFSKSGWGAFSLLLRNPNVFARAAAWDAPLMMAQPNRYGMGEIFGTQANFEGYRIAKLLALTHEDLVMTRRLILMGHANFADHHAETVRLFQKWNIPHTPCASAKRNHDWHSGWVAEGVEALLKSKR